MKHIAALLFAMLMYPFAHGQSPMELYNQKKYVELVKLEKTADRLSAEELYMVGFAHFQLENDIKAIEFYDKAIAKGLNTGAVHFYKGMSLRYEKNYDEALKEIELSLKLEPTNQEFMNEKGMVFYSQKQYDKALEIFDLAKELPNTFPEPFYWRAKIFYERGEFDKAIPAYYTAVAKLPKENSLYINSLISIGELEYNVTKEYGRSAKAFADVIRLDPSHYEFYYKLIQSYNASKEYTRADSVFRIVKTAFENGKLPKEDMELKTISIARFDWNGQRAIIRKSLIDPKEVLDVSYKVFLLTKDGSKVERRFLVEKTFQIKGEDTKHLLCEEVKKTGEHITYPYGWSTDDISIESLQEAVSSVLSGKMKAAASSRAGSK